MLEIKKTQTPSVNGTAEKVIGKQLSPIKPRQKMIRKVPEKAIWIGRLHRDTTEDDISTYIKNEWNIMNVDQLEIRKLVKKDRDLSEYTFVSFKVGCSAELFNTLMDVTKWPSNCQIREFKIEPMQSLGVIINNENTSKNDEIPHEVQPLQPLQPPQVNMEGVD